MIPINPWPNPIFHDTGILIEGHRRLLFPNGQCAVAPDGQSMHGRRECCPALRPWDGLNCLSSCR
jgi:hypothetical protein